MTGGEPVAEEFRQVKDAKMGRTRLDRGRTRYYLICGDCRREYNVSPYQLVGETYYCPKCEAKRTREARNAPRMGGQKP